MNEFLYVFFKLLAVNFTKKPAHFNKDLLRRPFIICVLCLNFFYFPSTCKEILYPDYERTFSNLLGDFFECIQYHGPETNRSVPYRI